MRSYFTFLCLALFLFSGAEVIHAQFDIPPKPPVSEQTSVYDYTSLLSYADKAALEQKLINYADTTGTQIVVFIIETSNGEDLAMLGAKWGQTWGIGQANEDNGIVILLAEKDRKVDISTGYGIEYRITDRMAKRVIDDYMIPQFRNNKYYNGLDAGTDVLIQMLAGEFKEQRKPTKGFAPGQLLFIGLFILFIIIMIRSVRNDNNGKGGKGRKGRDASIWDVIILSNMGRTGGGWSSGGGSFGGGSFGGGFGGGGFGGGGAGGSW